MILLRFSLLFLFAFSFTNVSQATHTYGGELSWRCLPSGKYQFFMTFYRDCSGIPWKYNEEKIQLVGSPLPKDSVGNSIDSITLIPDSSKWLLLNQGDFAPKCTKQYGSPGSCANGDNGVVQRFFYKSKPITLEGVPPSGGWEFYWTSACCRPTNLTNVTTSVPNITNAVVLRAVLFPTANNNSIDSCFYSSAEFIAPPTTSICRGENAYINYSINTDGDSLSYHWDEAINPPVSAPTSVPYKTGYSFDNPTPDTSFDSRNIPSTLNGLSGKVKLGIQSGVGIDKFLNIIRVDSWRDGTRLSSIYRELPLTISDCPKLPSGNINSRPIFHINNVEQEDTVFEVRAGDKISLPIKILDNDSNGFGNQLQLLRLKSYGLNFSSELKDSTVCPYPPCAYLDSVNPFFDSTFQQFIVSDSASIETSFEWQTRCNHLLGKSSQLYQFNFEVQDDHCPIPAYSAATIIIRVLKGTSCNTITDIAMNRLNKFSIDLFPNPTGKTVTINTQGSYKNIVIQVRNIHGQLVQEKQFFNRKKIELDIEAKAGIYFIQLVNDKGQKANFKVIKQ